MKIKDKAPITPIAENAVQDCSRKTKRRGWAAYFGTIAAFSMIVGANTARAEKPEIDVSYADGQTYYMIGSHQITNPAPNLLAQSEELYVLVYPLNPSGATNLGTLTLPSGYQPNCDPCFHPGLPPQFAYHDHVLTGAPGLGTSGTAGSFKGPWKIVVLMYRPEVVLNPTFQPIMSETDLKAAEAAGEFLPISSAAESPFEFDTGNVLICPFVSPHA